MAFYFAHDTNLARSQKGPAWDTNVKMTDISNLLGDKVVIFDLNSLHPPTVNLQLPQADNLYLADVPFLKMPKILWTFVSEDYSLLIIATRPVDRYIAALFILFGGSVYFLPHGKNTSLINFTKITNNFRKYLSYLSYDLCFRILCLFIPYRLRALTAFEFGFDYPVQLSFRNWNISFISVNYLLDEHLIGISRNDVKHVFIDQPLASDGIYSQKIYESFVMSIVKNYNLCAIKLHPRTDLREEFIVQNSLKIVNQVPLDTIIIGFNSSLLVSLEFAGFATIRKQF